MMVKGSLLCATARGDWDTGNVFCGRLVAANCLRWPSIIIAVLSSTRASRGCPCRLYADCWAFLPRH